MIKNLLDADENPPPGIKVTIEETIVEPAPVESQRTTLPAETEEILEIPATVNNAEFSAMSTEPPTSQMANETFVAPPQTESETTLFQTDYKPDSTAATIRKSGLAYAAAIMLFSSVVFMLIIGWIFDWLLGTSPWGIVVGIAVGAIIGFYQFFRLTSQIINDKN